MIHTPSTWMITEIMNIQKHRVNEPKKKKPKKKKADTMVRGEKRKLQTQNER
jgi:hypothetical protein